MAMEIRAITGWHNKKSTALILLGIFDLSSVVLIGPCEEFFITNYTIGGRRRATSCVHDVKSNVMDFPDES